MQNFRNILALHNLFRKLASNFSIAYSVLRNNRICSGNRFTVLEFLKLQRQFKSLKQAYYDRFGNPINSKFLAALTLNDISVGNTFTYLSILIFIKTSIKLSIMKLNYLMFVTSYNHFISLARIVNMSLLIVFVN